MKRIILTLVFVMGCSPKTHKTSLADKIPLKGAIPEVAQRGDVDNWFTKSPEGEQVEGTRADLAYTKLNLTKGKEIIVAVVDSGVDILHEDLKDKVWKNAGEVGTDANGKDKSTNKLDDDGNGYVDDVHGWNFIGGYDSNGNIVNIEAETLEVTRELVKMKKKKADAEAQGQTLSQADQDYLDHLDTEVAAARKDAQDSLDILNPALKTLEEKYEVLKTVLNETFENVTVDLLKGLTNLSLEQEEAQKAMLQVFTDTQFTNVKRMVRIRDAEKDSVDYYYNESFNPRATIVKDNPDDFSDLKYGNNDVTGPDSFHGTHVSGIIGATRGNSIGVDGIANDVKIMAIRAIPNGDERDKDVALAIRYAADNGAHVVNMSFGKGYSPDDEKVSSAMQYAASKGVILVHAAGNDSENNDSSPNFPNRKALDANGNQIGEVSTWIEVGASTAYKDITELSPKQFVSLVAGFSNFGLRSVDIFAPGFRIKSTIPGNKYDLASGTSMASPTVSGVVALTLSQRPDLSPWMARQTVLASSRRHSTLEVLLPGTADKIAFGLLSITGGIADALSALELAR